MLVQVLMFVTFPFRRVCAPCHAAIAKKLSEQMEERRRKRRNKRLMKVLLRHSRLTNLLPHRSTWRDWIVASDSTEPHAVLFRGASDDLRGCASAMQTAAWKNAVSDVCAR
jgi:hypothetical protein